MLVENIIDIEKINENEIHLLRDRLFFQAWERSAYLFSKLIRPYLVHSRYVKKVSSDCVLLGFPKSNLGIFEEEVLAQGFTWNVLDENHIVVGNLPSIEGFESWKNSILENSCAKEILKSEKTPFAPSDAMLALNRQLFDLTAYFFRVSSEFHRNFKYGLGERARENIIEMMEYVHCIVNGCEQFKREIVIERLYRFRAQLRLLHELRQFSTKQWIFMIERLEEMLKIIGWSPVNQGLSEKSLI